MWLKSRKVVNLALQGGGAHGAFTWGVLDRFLEDERLEIEGISGTSSGAMNAVALAYGMTVDGREGARHSLASLWNRVGISIPGYSPSAGIMGVERSFALEGALAMTRIFSPYQLNPMNLDPLREIVISLFDFEQLREQSKINLFIAATQVSSGKLRLFETREMTPEALLASACLPTLHHAVMIDGEAYWDGGYAGNPVLFPLFYDCRARDIAIILLHPRDRPQLPTSVSSIQQRTAELSFGTTFLREMRSIVHAKQQVSGNFLLVSKLERRLRRLNLHMIEPDQALTKLDGASKLDNDSAFLHWLKDRGRAAAQIWLEQNFDMLGRRSSIDLEAMFG